MEDVDNANFKTNKLNIIKEIQHMIENVNIKQNYNRNFKNEKRLKFRAQCVDQTE